MKASVCAALLYSLFSTPAMALGFGELTRHSALGQPFLADVNLVGVNGDAETRCFRATLNNLDGERLGTLSFSVNNGDGASRLYMSTREALNEPAVIISVESICAPQSRRDYQVLLDLDKPNLPFAASTDGARSGNAPAGAGLGAGGNGDATPKKSRRRRGADVATAAAVTPANDVVSSVPSPSHAVAPVAPATPAVPPATQVVPQAKLKTSTALDKKRARQAAKVFRNVLSLGGDPSVDDNLNGVDSVHLSLSHGLHGENSDLDLKVAPPGDAVAQGANGNNGANGAGAAPNANAATDAALKDLQAKIGKLEAQTEELKKLNAKQVADLDAARKEKETQGNQIYLYFLLLACVVAIAWLLWRSRQIQAGINHSWEDILPEDEGRKEEDNRQSSFRVQEDDDFLDEKPVRQNGKAEAKAQAGAKAGQDMVPELPDLDPLDALEQEAPAPSPAPRKDDFMATLAMPRIESGEPVEGDYKFSGNVRQSLPDAEEILDEIQQAEFWMDMQQPQRAIEILESNWGTERPSSPLPWLYLFDLYRMVGDQKKYDDLAERFQRIFNGKVISWEEKELLQHQRTLEEFPILLKKITDLWKTEEIIPFMESLLIDDRDGRRQGFDLAAYRDILFLANIAYENQDHGAPPPSESTIDAPDWSVLNH